MFDLNTEKLNLEYRELQVNLKDIFPNLNFENIKKECDVSDQWFNNFVYKLDKLNDFERLRYIYCIYLKGSNLGVEEENE